MKDKTIINVSSHNQYGGITAGVVNLNSQRRLDMQNGEALLHGLPENIPIRVVAPLGDGEAISFASQVRDFLKSKGRDVSGFDQIVNSTPMVGQTIYKSGNSYEIHIGHNQ
jgi:hypothetical protein